MLKTGCDHGTNGTCNRIWSQKGHQNHQIAHDAKQTASFEKTTEAKNVDPSSSWELGKANNRLWWIQHLRLWGNFRNCNLLLYIKIESLNMRWLPFRQIVSLSFLSKSNYCFNDYLPHSKQMLVITHPIILIKSRYAIVIEQLFSKRKLSNPTRFLPFFTTTVLNSSQVFKPFELY